MNARLTFRSLLTTTSMAALLVASHGAKADGYENSGTTDQIKIISTQDYVTNSGTVTNVRGLDGIKIEGQSVYGSVTNSGSITADQTDKTTDDDLRGISILSSTYIGDDILNSGSIAIIAAHSAHESFSEHAAGIEFGDGSVMYGDVTNQGSFDVTSTVTADTGCEEDDATSLEAEAEAYGISFDNTGNGSTSAGAIRNTGSIDVRAAAKVEQSASDESEEGAYAEGTGNAHAYAAGIDAHNDGDVDGGHHGPRLASEVSLDPYYSEDGIDVAATAQSFSDVDALATCYESGSCYGSQHAEGVVLDYASAQAYGVTLGGNAAMVGPVYNDTTIDVSALAETHSVANANSSWDDARAYAGYREYDYDDYDYYNTSRAEAAATGLDIDVMQVTGAVQNDDDIYAHAVANGQSTATATAAGYAEAGASNQASARARGLSLDVLLVSGNVTNTAGITGFAEATSDTDATAHSDTEGRAWASSSAMAQATGIALAADSIGGTFTNDTGGYDYDYEDGLVMGSAIAHSLADATTSAGEYSSAWARGDADAKAYGINADVVAIAGHFINEGDVEANALAWGEQTAAISDDESQIAAADGSMSAQATGIHLGGETLAGSFLNDGNVDVTATARGTSIATANGLDDILASATNRASAYARGVSVYEDEIQDSIRNADDIHVAALADVTQTATATASEDGEGDAAALSAEYEDFGERTTASAYATGLLIQSGEIGGNVVNDDSITVDATANVLSTIGATATNDGDAWSGATSNAYAEGYGIRAGIGELGYGSPVDDDEDWGNGYFVNDGEIDVDAAVNITNTVTSIADDGDAGAAALLSQDYHFSCYSDCGPNYNATAYGISLGDNEEGSDLNGDFLNFSGIDADAAAVATLTARATVDNGDDTAALTMAGGDLSSGAFGVALDGVYANGEFYNDGEISATARTTANANAFADSDDGPAIAIIGSDLASALDNEMLMGFAGANLAESDAVGVLIEDSDFEDGFWNDGTISALAFAQAAAEGEALGDEVGAVFAQNSAHAVAAGVEFANAWFGDDVVNSGTIAGIAAAYVDTSVHAVGDVANAYIGNGESSPAWAEATAVGMSAEGYYGATIHNGSYDDYEDSEDGEGQIWALAGAVGNNSARAQGQFSATASAINREYASATGYEGPEYSSYSGVFINDGLIVAGALAYGQEEAEATTTSDGGEAVAQASDNAEADAVGIAMSAYEITNRGQIFAGALAISDASASAEGGTANADADAQADAAATGISMYGESEATFYNSGAVGAYAHARAHADANIDFAESSGSLMSASAEATANAIGVSINSGSFVSDIHNDEDGAISATANAAATTGDEGDGSAYAYATGLRLSEAAFGAIRNDGEISANATGERAYAYGVHIDGAYDTYSGTLNNTGTISASATAENPQATAIMLSDGALVGDISNSGDILSEVEDTSEFDLFDYDGPHAVAIDIRGGGAATGIQQLDGRIVGAIRMNNGYADTLNWSGGTISGDITGNHEENEEGGDTLNVFAGEDDTFTYADTIDGFDDFNVNGGEHTATVGLRLTNTVRNIGNFNVGPNGTVTVGTEAGISTEALNLNSGATLAFELTTEGANGVINTSSADLGGATVKGVFLDAGLPVSQTYRVINWDGSDSRFGTVVSNSLIEKIVAQYGEDGVDLLVTRLSFAGVDGLKDDATSFGKALDRVFDGIDPDSPLGKAIYQLILLTPEEYSAAMNEIAGQQTADVQSITFSQAGSLIHVIQTQLSELRGGTVASADARSVGIRVASNQLTASMSDAPQAGMGASGTTLSGDWSTWARVFGDWADLDRSSVAAGFTSTTGGVVLGGDYSFSPNFLAGLAVGYQSSDMDFRGTGEGDISSWSATAYGDYRIGALYIDALAGYAVQSYDMDRYLTVLGTSYVANSDYDGSSIIGSVETGYEVAVGEGAKLTPFAGINFTHTRTDAVTETGAGIWNLAYDDRDETGVDSVLGARLSKSFVTAGGTKLTPTVELGWKHAFGDTSPIANAALAGTPGSNFQIFGSTASRDTAIVGAALSVQMTDTIDAYVQYNGQYSSNYMDNTASLRLRWKF
ncbi:MAG: autotransporter outer membrane beta-barrel domain-containing protein [Parvibaculum sp.]|uniref:autotransporter outer membrane beta-barrel domain-containing protein n=1 Tax=Parvibaculum sp. TaxID=2024848 RepID=UPI0025F37CAB|nr:autotransporter outer membrane beta-barrel domain-containing protein [Parvibaculum sp.]MCE9648444.1 autotransporter outer membrane beta-barrel domain-containing protein [Parvibaculum sp.]